jgi:trans-2,3-dihydro-3-hydroxyanthranilate isomerase
MQRATPLRLEISQGESVGRPSSLYLEVSAEREIFVGGDVREVARGRIDID